MSDKIKVKPLEGQKFKEIEVSTKNWNLDTRKEINKLTAPVLAEENMEIRGNMMFEVGCEILGMATTLTEEEMKQWRDSSNCQTDFINEISLIFQAITVHMQSKKK